MIKTNGKATEIKSAYMYTVTGGENSIRLVFIKYLQEAA